MSHRAQSHPPMRVLLVEDDPAHAELIRRGFEDHDLQSEIVHLTDGADALDYLNRRGRWSDAANSPRPQLILLDLRLPKVDGVEVLAAVKTTPDLQSIPVVMLTTSAAEQDMHRAYHRHVNSYLVKPIDFDRFGDLMKELGLYWLVWNRSPSTSG
ncbi:MAG: response regulator [Acidobacteria bacterium]|nr:response regulator [Acidobacteriota bacterium]